MIFWILVGFCVTAALISGIHRYVKARKSKDYRLKWAVGQFFEVLGMTVAISVTLLIFAAMFTGIFAKDTIVSSVESPLHPASTTDKSLVVSTGSDPRSIVLFNSSRGREESVNSYSSIFTDAPAGHGTVTKIENRTLVPWLFPFPMGGNTHYDIHVAPGEISGPHLVSVR